MLSIHAHGTLAALCEQLNPHNTSPITLPSSAALDPNRPTRYPTRATQMPTLAPPISCSSAGGGVCLTTSVNTRQQIVAEGYYCKSSVCVPCPSGTYGIDGKTCRSCPFATSSVGGSTVCTTQLRHTTVGFFQTYIPYGISKISIRLWGGGGGGCFGRLAATPPQAGGGGGFSTCTLSVQEDSRIFVLVGGGAKGNGDFTVERLGGQ